MSSFLSSPFGPEKDAFFMDQALLQAQEAFLRDEVPVGAIVVNGQGEIVSASHNLVEAHQSQLFHAEMNALRESAQKRGNWRLNDCWLYVSLEPCSMCMACIKLSRCAGVVYGAQSPLFGFQLDNNNDLPLYKKNALQVLGGVGEQKSTDLLKQFFQKKRISRE